MDYSVLLVAAGKKAGEGQSYEKALASFNESRSVLAQTISIFLSDDQCKQIVIVTSPADMHHVVSCNESGKIIYVKGGRTRQESVLIGLTAISEDVVLIHDGVRPWLSQTLINKLTHRMDVEKACVLAIPPRATLHRVVDGYIAETMDDADVMMSQTPQAFQTAFIIDCYRKALRDGVYLKDDAAIVGAVSDQPIAVEKGDVRNARFIPKTNL